MYRSSKEYSKKYNKQYYKKNKEKMDKASKKWRKDNPEGTKAIMKRANAKTINKIKKEEWVKNNPHQRKITSKKYAKKNPLILRLNAKKYREKYREKIIAQRKASKLKIGKKCQICGDKKQLERHHWRYDKPLLISTLCHSCHTVQHRKYRRKSHSG